MDYYLDTEFLEGTQKKRLFGVPYGETPNTIDLISIGIVAEDGREYYAISKDFNLKEAWNRHELKINKQFPVGPKYWKKYWIRENVLKPIFHEFIEKEFQFRNKQERILGHSNDFDKTFSFKNFKQLLKKYGKSNQEIAEEIKKFTYSDYWFTDKKQINGNYPSDSLTQFYAYYADYDWVVFCWLFGKMIDLPKGFPMYCNDLKQELDKIQKFHVDNYKAGDLKSFSSFPKQTNEHNALADAQWNKKLHEFLKSI